VCKGYVQVGDITPERTNSSSNNNSKESELQTKFAKVKEATVKQSET